MKTTSRNSSWLSETWRNAAIAAVLLVGALSRVSAQQAPQIVSTSPAMAATDVDPGLTEITVTFDQDMGGGMSWTGGGPEFPSSPESARAHWVDKRTCALPVMLQPGHQYRVGINSQSFRNFKSASGVSAAPVAITFATRGAVGGPKVKVPRIVGLNPRNGTNNVSPGLTELRVTFDVAMNEGCSWTGGGPEFPTIPDGKKPYWTDDHKTCVLPVELKPNQQYRLGLNSPSFKNFQSAEGVPLQPVGYSFRTGGN
ncbi:MAG TPA: Ig-like domain-containing protein [Candidatus Dormibacteraeota bacterium]|nr:Ig-like domain-containing protein [Candidatus Dormibacteraeota bacterium]